MKVRVAGIVPESIVDGPGIRYAVFVQGCPHRCPGCHNPETHPFEAGEEMDAQDLFAAFQRDPLLKGVTLSGGEPFCQPEPVTELARQVHAAGKDVVVFTGYLFEELAASSDPTTLALLQEADLLIDGPYLEAQRDIDLRFRGSANQRLVDVKKSLAAGHVVLWPEE